MRKKTIEHVFDAYVDKLPGNDFGGPIPVPPVGNATGAADASAEFGVKPGVAHQRNDAKEVAKGSLQSGKLNDSSTDGMGGGLNRVAGVEGDGDEFDCGNFLVGRDSESARSAFVWVASHEGDEGPRTAVLARNAQWAVVARDVRFRLASAWFSCDQVYNGTKQMANISFMGGRKKLFRPPEIYSVDFFVGLYMSTVSEAYVQSSVLYMQAKVLARVFPERAKGITSNPREDLVVELFGRVTDIDNFPVVLATLGEEAQLSVGRRLGWLNVLNPLQVDRRARTCCNREFECKLHVQLRKYRYSNQRIKVGKTAGVQIRP